MCRARKIILIGDSSVGKTSLVSSYIGQPFNLKTVTTIQPVFFNSTINLNGKTINFEIWDTAGQEQYKSLMPVYYRGAKTAILCFDKDSYENIEKWVKCVLDIEPSCQFVLVLTKSDLYQNEQIQHLTSIGNEAKKGLNLFDFIVTSAKENAGIQDVFFSVARSIPETDFAEDKKLNKLIVERTDHGCCQK